MTEEAGKLINEYLLQIAENLPLFEHFNLRQGVLKNLTIQEIHTIALVGRLNRPRMSELAQRGHVTRGTMTVMVNKLVRKGYVKRILDAKDGRVVRVGLTPRGIEANRLHEAFHTETMERIVGVLDEREQRQLVKLMKRLAAVLG